MLHGPLPPHRFLPYLSWTQIDALTDKAGVVIVLPAGSIEQHGPHLSCAVDAQIAVGVVGEALRRLPASVSAFALPPLVYGKSDEHADFPGTLTLDGATLQAMVEQIGDSIYRAGFRKLLIVNAHGGQPQVMEIAAMALRARHRDFIVVPHFVWRVPHRAAEFLSERERRLGLHAGHAETALVLALAPETVRMAHAVAHLPPEFPSQVLADRGRAPCAWMVQDLSPNGVVGDPLPATADQGSAILDSLAASWAEAITDLHRLQWPAGGASASGNPAGGKPGAVDQRAAGAGGAQAGGAPPR
jgi:creatinine amidohydrolase